MEIGKKRISVRVGDEINLYFLGDIHEGNCNVNYGALEEAVQMIKNDPNAYWIGMGDYCMPLDTEILTRGGWKRYNEIAPGEDVLSYADGRSEWSKLKGIYFTPSCEIVELRSKSYKILASRNHRHVVEDKYRNHVIKTTDDLKTTNRIVIAAPFSGVSKSTLTDDEIKLISWIVTDGHIRMSSKHGLNACIVQSKPHTVLEIRAELSKYFTKEYLADGGCIIFNIKAESLNKIREKIGFEYAGELKSHLPQIASQFDKRQAEIMMRVFLSAEGWKNKSGNYVFSQSHKNQGVIDAFHIVSALCGERCSIGKYNKAGVLQQTIMSRKVATVADMKIQSAGFMPAWCPVVENGTWVCRQGNQISITGNCEAITYQGDKRFDPLSISKKYNINDLKDLPFRQAEHAYSFLSPIDGKCLALLGGNHEEKYSKYNSSNVYKRFIQMFKTSAHEEGKPPFMVGYVGFYLLQIENKADRGKRGVVPITIALNHGVGGSGYLEGYKTNKVHQVFKYMYGDINVMGHIHQLDEDKKDIVTVSSRGSVKRHRRYWGISGCFLNSYVDGNTNYYEAKAGASGESDIGMLKCGLKFYRKKYEGEIKWKAKMEKIYL